MDESIQDTDGMSPHEIAIMGEHISRAFEKVSSQEWVTRIRRRTEDVRHYIKSNAKTIMSENGQEAIQEDSWTVSRSISRLLKKGNSYDVLPEQTENLIRNLDEDSLWVDVGCGTGDFQVSARSEGLTKCQTVGVDMLHHSDPYKTKYSGPERLDDFIISDVYETGHIDRLKSEAKLVTAATLLYHLDDPILAIREMGEMVAPGGTLVTNTFPRLVQSSGFDGRPVDDQDGMISELIEFKPFEGPEYFQRKSSQTPTAVDIEGRIVAPGELFARIREYSHASGTYTVPSGTTIAENGYSGRITLTKQDEFNFGCIFYGEKEGRKVYIVAKSNLEMNALKSAGFQSVEDMYNELGKRSALG